MDKSKLIFGSAYYDEYAPYDRLEQDMDMMVEAGFTTIRIAESTWSVEEPSPGVYDFSHIDRVIDAAERHGLNVIVGTPTYAVPYWLVQLDPDVMVTTRDGKAKYGPRQQMDITNPTYRFYAERIIRRLVEHTVDRPNVIGFQIDNETKHYGTAGDRVTIMFQRWLAEKFGTIERVNEAFGLNYWSNSVTRFEDLPNPVGTINGSYACEFAKFQRNMAERFLMWQSNIVREYLRPDQFITQNFDYEWNMLPQQGKPIGFSWGVQPDICHWYSSKALTLVGTDIYFYPQDQFTGCEAAFGGDLMRSLKKDNYLVLESQAQAFKEWLPYPGQLRLMAFSHLASGACGVMYWHWASLHNAVETYWKGLLGHDYQTNPTYEEACTIGRDFKRLSPALAGMKKKNRIALMVSTNTANALRWFPTDGGLTYNDVVHWVYDALYELNLECDIIFTQEEDWWKDYDMVVFPELYSAHLHTIEHLREFVEKGGTAFATFRSFVTDKHVKVFHETLPYHLTDVFGMSYNQFTAPGTTTVDGTPALHWMELLKPESAETVASYTHRYWGKYAAVTRNHFGAGHAWYVGTMLDREKLKEYLLQAAADAGITPPEERWPLIHRVGTSPAGARLHYLLNYSGEERTVLSRWNGRELLSGNAVSEGDSLTLTDWGVLIIEEEPD